MKPVLSALSATVLILGAATAFGGVPTPHLIPFQGRALDSGGQPLATGDVTVRIYDAPAAGTLVYDSGTQFAGAVQNGVFNVLLGQAPALLLDNTQLYYLEVDLNGQEVVGDAAGGRQPFYPGGGSHDRSDLDGRIQALENLVFMTCAPGTYDLNKSPRDGCEFQVDPNGIYVSQTTGADDAGCGSGPDSTCSGCYPCRTIGYGIQRAQGAGKSTVYVADGLYEESVTVIGGISLRGGYRADTWERHLSTSLSVIRDVTPSGHRKAIIAQNITSPAVVEGFVVQGRHAAGNGENSYAFWIVDCSAGLSIQNNQVYAGDGGPGLTGADGTDGAVGVNGQNGLSAYEPAAGYNCYEECVGHGAERQGGAGGSKTCGGTNCSGGAGGTADCPNFDDSNSNACSQCPTDPISQVITTNGSTAPNGGGVGGDGTGDALLDFDCAGDCYAHLCDAPDCVQSIATRGEDGRVGTSASGGAGSTQLWGTVTSHEWIGGAGAAGGSAGHGSGGGGGGASGGVETRYHASCSSAGHSDIGGSGGGGGSGGCGGTGGGGGMGGGGSIGIFVFFSAAPGSNIPTISGNAIHRGNGGHGGHGGQGGTGGMGGYGGAGGPGGNSGSSYQFAGAGAPGGDGGHGGHGGGGGGGTGGVSCGIFAYGQGGSSLNAWKVGNSFFADGTSGSGGAGGLSQQLDIGPGGPGVTGGQSSTNF